LFDAHPVAAAIVVGLVLRSVAAASCSGFFASDDYRYVIVPAWTWVTTPEAAFPSHYRSPLLAWLMLAVFRGCREVGLTDLTVNLRIGYGSWDSGRCSSSRRPIAWR